MEWQRSISGLSGARNDEEPRIRESVDRCRSDREKDNRYDQRRAAKSGAGRGRAQEPNPLTSDGTERRFPGLAEMSRIVKQ